MDTNLPIPIWIYVKIDIPEGTKKTLPSGWRTGAVRGGRFRLADFAVPWGALARSNKPFPGKWVVNVALFYPHEKVGKNREKSVF